MHSLDIPIFRKNPACGVPLCFPCCNPFGQIIGLICCGMIFHRCAVLRVVSHRHHIVSRPRIVLVDWKILSFAHYRFLAFSRLSGNKLSSGYTLIKRPHTFRRSCFIGCYLALLGFTLKPKNLLTVIESLPAFSTFTASDFRCKVSRCQIAGFFSVALPIISPSFMPVVSFPIISPATVSVLPLSETSFSNNALI